MGQTSSAPQPCGDAKKGAERPPTFAEILEKRATEAQARSAATVEAFLDSELTEAARAADVVHCVDAIVARMLKAADAGRRHPAELSMQSPLFGHVYAKAVLVLDEAARYRLSDYVQLRLKRHVADIEVAFSKRTQFAIFPSSYACINGQEPRCCFCVTSVTMFCAEIHY
jgi:hypothetical protein